jgi:hypothetical protein
LNKKEEDMEPKAFIAAVEAAWRTRIASPIDGKRLTRLHVHVAAKLAFWRGSQCRQKALARAANCDVRTVRRALHLLNALSLLGWTKITLAGKGWRVRVCNVYHLGVKEILKRVFFTSACLSAGVETEMFQKARRRVLKAWALETGQNYLLV